MARSNQNDPERQLAPEVESALHDRAEIVQPQDRPFGRSVAAKETLNIGHAGLRSECWAALTPRSPRKRTPKPSSQAPRAFLVGVKYGRSSCQRREMSSASAVWSKSQDLVHRPPAAANWASLRGHSSSSFTGGVRFEAGAAVAIVAIVSSMVVYRCPLASHRATYSNSGRILDARKSAELYGG